MTDEVSEEPTRTVTITMPESMHKELRRRALALGVSVPELMRRALALHHLLFIDEAADQ